MTKTMYKVVRLLNGRYVSCLKQNGLVYEIGYTTFPDIGKIFCFSNLEDARSFFRDETWIPGLCILSGIGENPKRIKLMSMCSARDELFWKLYKNKKGIKGKMSYGHPPTGSFVVDNFTPNKVLQ